MLSIRKLVTLNLTFAIFVLLLPALLFAGTFNLPDTGQTKCYQTIEPWAEIPCEGTGQDGAYTINSMSFTDNGDGTVTDNNTGLVWQKEDDETAYNWYQASGTHDETDNPSSQDVCGSLNLGGHSDWRLPTKKELMSIVDYGIPSTGPPTINATYFPNTKMSYYWSSTMSAYSTGYAWYVGFVDGVVYYHYKHSYSYVRCVRSGQYPEQNFVDNNNGTVTDNATGLMWQQGEPGYMIWEQALNYCEELTLANKTDWCLPNIKELESITDDTRLYPAIDTAYFPNVIASYYWSSTTNASNPHDAWGVNFNVGYVSYASSKDHSSRDVRCVRGGNPAYGNLEVSPSSHDFGELFVGECDLQLFTINNTGNADLNVSNISLSDTTNFDFDTTIIYVCSTSGEIINPGDSCNVVVKFCPSISKTFDTNLSISSNDPDTPTLNVPITGSAKKLCNPPGRVYAKNENAYGLFEGFTEIEEIGDNTIVDIDIQGTDIFPLIGGTLHFWATIDVIKFDSDVVTDFGPNPDGTGPVPDDAVGRVYAEKRIIAPGTHASFRAIFCKPGSITYKLSIANLRAVSYTMADILLTGLGLGPLGGIPVDDINAFVNDISNPDDFPSINSAMIHLTDAMNALSRGKIARAYLELSKADNYLKALAQDKNQLIKLKLELTKFGIKIKLPKLVLRVYSFATKVVEMFTDITVYSIQTALNTKKIKIVVVAK